MHTKLPDMTLNKLKTMVNNGTPVYVEVMERFGKTGDDIPARLRGVRRIRSAHSYGFEIELIEPTPQVFSTDPKAFGKSGTVSPHHRECDQAGNVFTVYLGKMRTSRLNVKASLCSISDGVLTVYTAGTRPLNEEEQKKLDDWAKIENTPEFQKQADIDILTDGSTTFWQQKRFFEGKLSYLFGEGKNGKELVYSKGNQPVIQDDRVRGDAILRFNVTVGGDEW